jgi:hypothetical protein
MSARAELQPEHVLEFVRRAWPDVESHKRAYWLRRVREHGAAEGLRASEMLREQVEPFARESAAARRAADLDALIALKKRIDAASHHLGR